MLQENELDALEEFTGLNEAIKDFNFWHGSALLYVDIEKRHFSTIVFHDEEEVSKARLIKNLYGVITKDEKTEKYIGSRRKQYISEFVSLMVEGFNTEEAKYELAAKYPYGSI